MMNFSKMMQAACLGLFLSMLPSPASLHATIVSVTGGGQIIAPPSSVSITGATNTVQQGFNERQNVTITKMLNMDVGTLVPGEKVNSQMIFLHPPSGHATVQGPDIWTFSSVILGVMSDFNGKLEWYSNSQLANPGTTYQSPTFSRGFDAGDSYIIAGNKLTVTMNGGTKLDRGDWIRVITKAGISVPEPATYLLCIGWLGLAAFIKRRKLAPAMPS